MSPSTQLVHPDDYLTDITVQIGLALREQLDQLYPGKIRQRLRDSPLSTVPGHTIFVPSSKSFYPTPDSTSTTDAVERILPIVVRDLLQQLNEAHIPEESDQWSITLTWDGHGLFNDGQFVQDGFGFDAYAEVSAETA